MTDIWDENMDGSNSYQTIPLGAMRGEAIYIWSLGVVVFCNLGSLF